MHRSICLLLALLTSYTASAQRLPFELDIPLPGVTGFESSIPLPEDVLGHRIGTRHTVPSQVVDYFRAVAAVSDRVVLEEHGRTYEGRPLIHAIVTSPANHARLGAIQKANQKLSDAPASVSDDDLAEMPVVLYQGYSIHGNEATGTEAALLYLYYLAAAQGPAIDESLEHAVIILDPMFNPDGRDRFTNWVNRNRGSVATTDAADREHNEPWPGGRTNHYWFDLNRDWLPAQHPESQGRLDLFHDWRPQLLTDHHEMGASSTFFFQPGIPSRNNPNTPQGTYDVTAQLAAYHARALDAIGAGYYSQESFDDFYLGKGSAYPDINGAIGILFEQASSRALLAQTTDGLLSYAYGVRNQFVASLSSLAGAVDLRFQFLDNQRSFYRTVPEFVAASPVKGYVVSLNRGAARADSLLAVLRRHDIRAFVSSRDIAVNGRTFKAGEAAILPLNQRQGRLLEASFERVFAYEDSLFYDVSTWTLPLAFDVDYAELTRDPAPSMGPEITAPVTAGGVAGAPGAYAYLMRWDAQYAPRALYRIQSAGIAVRLATRPFSAMVAGSEVAFEPGTIIIPAEPRDQASRLVAAPEVQALAEKIALLDGVQVFATQSGYTPTGPDLGGASTRTLRQPVVAIVTGDSSSSGSAGEIWHYFSEQLQMPVSLLDGDRVGRVDLSRYTSLILAGGSYSGMDTEAVTRWVQGGGHLIVMTSAMDWAIGNDLLHLTRKPFDQDSLLTGRPYDQIGDARGAQAIGGSIFGVDLDSTHPLAYGLPAHLPVFRQGNTFFEPSETPGATVGRYSELLSGYLSVEMADLLPGSAAAVVERSGRGRVIAFPDRLYFRAYFHGSTGLLANAVFLAGSF